MSESKAITINNVKYIPEDSAPKPTGNLVIIRTYSAGVHIGEMEGEWEDVNKPITLKNAVRLYRWIGANTLSEVAMKGVDSDEYTRISERVTEIKLSPIEVIKVAEGVSFEPVWN
jgi:hypothetical protein